MGLLKNKLIHSLVLLKSLRSAKIIGFLALSQSIPILGASPGKGSLQKGITRKYSIGQKRDAVGTQLIIIYQLCASGVPNASVSCVATQGDPAHESRRKHKEVSPMTRRENLWTKGSILLMIAAAITILSSCSSVTDPPAGGSTNPPIVSDDGGLPDCPVGKVDADGNPCHRPDSDGGVPDSTTCPDTDTEASPDAEPPPTDTGAPPEECPPSGIPNGTDCDGQCKIYWDNSNGNCLSDCEGVYNPSSPERISLVCGLGTMA